MTAKKTSTADLQIKGAAYLAKTAKKKPQPFVAMPSIFITYLELYLQLF